MASLTQRTWFEWTPGFGDGQGGLACCNSWGGKELDTNEQLNWTELNEKLIRSKNWSKNEMNNFIQSKLRIIIWEQHLRKIWVLFHPLEVQAVIKFFETEGCTLNVLLTQSKSASTMQWVIVILYKIRKEGYSFRSCLVDTKRMLLFVVEQVFLYIQVFLYLHVYK